MTAKLQENVPIPNEQTLPKNTVLEGHVDQVQPSQNKGDSTVVVTFDKARLKTGQELPIKATVVAISEPILAQEQNGQGGGVPADQGAMPASAPQGGGGGGGAGANSMPAAQPQEPTGPAEASPQSNPQQSAQKNGVPGVSLQSDIHQHSSATFTSKGKNVHVPDGTQMEVALAVIPPGVHLQ